MGEKALRRNRTWGLPSGSNWNERLGGDGKGLYQFSGVSILRVGTARCLGEGSGGDIEVYEGGADGGGVGEAIEMQWMGWSRELV
jgi:hypothetical protein